MRAHKRLTPYVRLANGRERSASWRVAMRLAMYQMKGKPFYVMVQRGFPNLVVECGASKKDVMRSPLVVARKRKTFRQWAKAIRVMGTKKGGAV